MRRSSSVTIVDVARAAGVSIATVSRALSHPERVRPERVERVRSAAASLGYVPHHAARTLASRRSNAIGAIVPTLDNAIFAKAIHALQRRLDAAGLQLLVASNDYDLEREAAQLQALVAHGVDGVVLVGASHRPRAAELLAAKGVPHVCLWTHRADGAASIGFDNRAAMARLVSYLADLGHRAFAMIAGITRDNDRAAARVQGFRDALAARGIAIPRERVIERPYSAADGRGALRTLVAGGAPPTAIVCGNDILAFGALAEALALGLAVPGAVSITGFDDLELAADLRPPLTTMRVPSEAMGVRAAEHLLDRLAGEPTPQTVELEAELIVRGTTAPPPA
jgi:LacI family transcriptional regulator